MNQETLDALNGSIRKWEKIVNDGAVDEHIDGCPLCILFYEYSCDGCPVFYKTGFRRCENTPHETWTMYCDEEDKDYEVFDEESRGFALAELNFLKSLLPEDS
jgi:hypothetical protein